MTTCSHCGSDVEDNLARCPCCDSLAGYPNVKMAQAEAAVLRSRADAARSAANTRGAGAPLAELELALETSQAVVNVDVGFLHQLLGSGKALYAAYGKLIAAGVRAPADPENDRQRTAVEGVLFGSWGSELAYAALALDGRGLGTYGSVSMELQPKAIDRRASVLEENSYQFVRGHRLVAGDPIPPGYRAPWQTRQEVCVAKLAARVTPTTTSADHPQLVLSSDGKDRDKDEFIEVHIYGPFNRDAVCRITVLSVPTDEADRHRLEGLKRSAKSRGIDWREP